MRKIVKRTLSLFTAAIICLSLAGCGGGSGKEGAAKDTLTVLKNEDVTSLDPGKAMNQRSFSIYSQMFEGLVKYNPDTKKIDPCLATDWKQIDDTTWHFNLRKGVKFHDGTTMTSKDVVYSLMRYAKSPVVSTYMDWVADIQPDGDYAVTIKTKKPYATLISCLTYPVAVIFPQGYFEKVGESGFGQKPVGTGPYKFVKRAESDSIAMERFDEYWGDKAKTKNLVFKIIPEGSQRTVMLQNGEADIVTDVITSDAASIAQNDKLSLLKANSNKYYSLMFKCNSKTPIKDPKVRQAIAYAIDKKPLVDVVMNGYGQVGSLLVTPTVKGYDKAKDQGNLYNETKAKELLKEAGYPNGFEIEMYVRSGQPYEELTTVVQDQLKKVGINVKQIVMDSNKIQEKLFAGDEVPIEIGFLNNITGDTDFIMQKLLPTTYGQTYFNDEMTVLINKARSEKTEEGRNKVYDEYFDLMAKDNSQISLFYEQMLIGMGKHVKGFKPNPLGAHQFSTVSVNQ